MKWPCRDKAGLPVCLQRAKLLIPRGMFSNYNSEAMQECLCWRLQHIESPSTVWRKTSLKKIIKYSIPFHYRPSGRIVNTKCKCLTLKTRKCPGKKKLRSSTLDEVAVVRKGLRVWAEGLNVFKTWLVFLFFPSLLFHSPFSAALIKICSKYRAAENSWQVTAEQLTFKLSL